MSILLGVFIERYKRFTANRCSVFGLRLAIGRARASARASHSLRESDSLFPVCENKNRPIGLFLFSWWRWRESNSRPKAFPQDFLRAQLMICYFASPIAHQQAIRSAISLFPYATENSRKVFLYNRCQISGLQVNRSWHAQLMLLTQRLPLVRSLFFL